MQTKAVLSALQQHCDLRRLPDTLSALRHDPLVWRALLPFDFERFTRKNSTELWTPASLALFALETDLASEDLRREPLTMLDGNLQRRALAVFEETLRTGREPADLREAGLLALALRERRRKTRSWAGLNDDLSLKSDLTANRIEGIWRSALACLYKLIPDGDGLLKALLSGNPVVGMGWCIHILLSNPADENEQAKTLAGLILDAPLEQQAAWLQRLLSIGRNALAEKIARILLASSQATFDELKKQYHPSLAETRSVIERAVRLQQAAVIYRCAGASLQSAGMLDKAQQLLAYCLADAQIQNAALDILDNKADVAAARVEKALQISRDARLIEAGVSVLHESGLLDVEIPSGDREPGFYSALYLARQMAAKGNIELACQTASRAVEAWLSTSEYSIPQPAEPEGNPVQALATLMGLNLVKEATQCSEVFLQRRPNDLTLLHRVARIMEKAGDANRAIDCAETAVLLQPQDWDAHRDLARLLEDQNLWARALNERRLILAGEANPQIEDRMALANCAIQAGEVGMAIEVCDQILAAQPEHGMAHTFKGQALLQMGQVEEAVSHLSRATLLCAELPRPWLALAEAQKKKGEMQRSLDTLRAAVLAVPDSSEVHFQLARTLLDQGYPTDALPNLRQAARLSPEAASVTIELAKTLCQLGHHGEAVRILSEARQRWPRDPHLAYLESVTYKELGNRKKALESLEVAVKADQPQIEWLRFYVQMQVQNPAMLYAAMPGDFDPILLQRLTQVLQKVLAIAPTDFTARMWMADILRLRGQEQQAFDAYQQLLDECGDQDPDLRTRVQAGFGAAALAADQLDTALACLQEVLQGNPDDLGAMHLLTETYFKLNLAQESAHAAEQALQMEPDQVNNLVWYAGVMERLGQIEDAQRALATAAQLSPERGDLWLKQAQFALQAGQPEKAHRLLEEIEHLANISEEELLRAAQIHLQLAAYPQALACLKRLEGSTPTPAASLLCDLAFLSQQTGDFQGAMAYAEQAVRTDDQNIRLHVLQADLLAQQDRPQAALACLEKAARLMESKSLSDQQPAQSKVSLFQVDEGRFNPASVYARSAVLLKQQGDIPASMFYAEKALDVAPDDPSIRLLMVGLAYSQLQFDHVLELTAAVECRAQKALLHADAEACRQALQAIRCEILLDAGNEVDVSAIVNAAQDQAGLQPRLKAIQVRLLARNGEYEAAGKKFSEELAIPEDAVQTNEHSFERTYHLDLNEYHPIWLGQAAQDLFLWEAADRDFEKGCADYPQEAIAHYQSAGALIRRTKAARLCDAVNASTHGPKPKAGLSEAFENALLAASQYSGSPKISELRQVGKLVFHTGNGQIKHVLTDGRLPGDRPALVIALAQNGNLPAIHQVAEQAKDQPEVYAQAAAALMSAEIEQALAFAQQAVELEPRQPIYHALRAMILSKANQPAEVMEAWQSALQYWPDEPTWRAALAQLSQNLGDTTTAIQHWDAAFSLRPEKSEYAFKLGKVYLETRNYGKAIDALETASRLDGGDLQNWLTLAEAHLHGGHFERALQCAQRAIALEPESLPAMLLLGEIYIRMGDLNAAQAISDRALKHGNTIPEVVVFNVHLLEKRGKTNDALAVLEQAASLLADELIIQLERARLIRHVYGSAAALPVIRDVARKFSANVPVLALLATTQYECGDSAGAEKAAQQALRLEPEQANLHLLMGQIKAAGGQLDQAVYHLSEAVQLNPADVEGYLELGRVYQDRREQDKAILTLQQAIKTAPRDPRAYVLAAAALREAKDYSSAESMLRKAADLAPNDLNIRRQLGAVIALNLVQHSQEAQAWH